MSCSAPRSVRVRVGVQDHDGATAGLLFLLFAAKSRLEEIWLLAMHPEYRDYERRTKRLIPWIY